MAHRYSMLPTDVLQKATTVDFQIYYNAHLIRIREEKKSRGESIADTFSQSEVDKMYSDFKTKRDGVQSK
jgi:hypothetical protein